MQRYKQDIGNWVFCKSDGSIGLVVDIRLDGYVQLAPSMNFYHPSSLREARSEEIRKAQIEFFDNIVKEYRKQLFVELCRIKKWKKAYKKETDLPINEVSAMVRMGYLPIEAVKHWSP